MEAAVARLTWCLQIQLIQAIEPSGLDLGWGMSGDGVYPRLVLAVSWVQAPLHNPAVMGTWPLTDVSSQYCNRLTGAAVLK